jgi:predicted O-methyltransferase YrrM
MEGAEARDADHELWAGVDDYIEGLLIPDDPVLEATLAANAAAGLPAHDVSATQGKLLFLLGRLARAKRVLEVGTLGGYSTIWIARALPEDGHLVSLEIDPAYAEVADRNLAHAGVAGRVEIRVGAAIDSLARLREEQVDPFDMVFIDADKPSNPDYLRAALDLSRPGTLIVGDNVVREGALIDSDSDDPRVQGVRAFHEVLAADPRIEATTIQTVGSKGYDGFSLALVRASVGDDS